MATDGPTPPPCDLEIFRNGQPVAALCGSSNAIEHWVMEVAKQAEAKVDWHYSGGVAQVLHLGDEESRIRVMRVMQTLEPTLKVTILQYFGHSDQGLHRANVTEVPEGTIAAFYKGGSSSTYMVKYPREDEPIFVKG